MNAETNHAARTTARGQFSLVDWGLPLFAAACGVVLTFEGLRLPIFERYTGLGAGFLPIFIGIGMLIIAGVLAWQVMQGERFEPEEAEGADAEAPVSRQRLGLAAVAVLSPVVTFPLVGFTIGGALSFVCVARAFGSKNSLLDLAIGLALAAVTWFAFTKLGVQLGGFLPFGVN